MFEFGEAAHKKYRKLIVDESMESKVPLKEAAATLKSYGLDRSLIDSVLDDLLAEQAKHQHLLSTVLDPQTFVPWYTGPKPDGQWARYFRRLREAKAPSLDNLSEETTTITSLLANPLTGKAKRKGLVMGNVQSGKTRNYAGVIAKAADEGYKFVIVLSGINNNLREQTQVRLNSDLFDGADWYPLTDKDDDFRGVLKPGTLFTGQKLLCAVVKKNPTRLHYLVKMLKSIPLEVLQKAPILIVDDEADQATPNSMAEKEKISTINEWLRGLWGTVVTGTYLAYTATPFANILMDPDNESDLFPSDFVTTIQPGEGYFGAERVFGVADTVSEGLEFDGLNMVRRIPAAEASSLKPPSNAEDREFFDPDLPTSLKAAFQWFVLATAIRRARGHMESHSSMLVHTTHYTAPHRTMKARLVAYGRELLSGYDTTTPGLLKAAWDEEVLKVASEATEPLPEWDNVQKEAKSVLKELEVIVDNGESADRLNYDPEGPVQTVVAVGGGTLSRGLTLEGLVVSYFTRTSNTYDTLLQMGRWFGYRPGYEDLPRVWVTAGLDTDYAYLARVEKDLRDEIASVQGTEYTPRQIGVRVRAHPGRLEITSKNKMFSAEIVQLGLSGTSAQTFLLDGRPSTIESNIEAANVLVKGLRFSSLASNEARLIAKCVDGERVSAFIRSFRAHEDQRWLTDTVRREATVEWIEKWARGDVWNIVLVGNSTGGKEPAETLKLGPHELVCFQRTPMKNSTEAKVDLKALTSQPDRLADIDSALYEGTQAETEEGRRRIRRKHGDGRGLILLYPLGSQAKASSDSDSRINMPIDRPMLGFAVVFPHVNDVEKDQGTFVSVKRTWDVPLTVEGDEEIVEDEAEEQGEE
ncbi:Z1 domain-containing protein [Tessaracoccus antarcticus]|uniref:Putative endonuclease Z1 domain-containing protein n=1 Tax=Tessaracoccus antarcticus TaxID=2479848 RepID=A0A3M0G8Y3_9ACTN|nr:Z1 domain-containing protein [Tessaracoccus antarcticus]RMB61445.1 hypothetical protein EAX62_01980 [Tessaracoccus antarcticus]